MLDAVSRIAYATPNRSFRVRYLAAFAAPERNGIFAAEHNGAIAGMVIGHDYGRYGYLSSMAVVPEMQGRGIGSALLDTVLAWFDKRAVPAIELDATPAGAPLYRTRGFVDDGITSVYHGEPLPGAPVAMVPDADTFAAVVALDARGSGGDRSAAIRALLADPSSCPFVEFDRGEPVAYAVYRSTLIGPWIAIDAAAAGRVFAAARRAVRATGFIVCTQGDHTVANAIVRDAGLMHQRDLAHMRRGSVVARPADAVYGRYGLGGG